MEAGQPGASGRTDHRSLTVSHSFLKNRRTFISPTSSFIDFGNLRTEYFTDEGREGAKYYDPHAHRVIKKPTTDFETTTHLLKGSIGAGILAMPKGFSYIGVVPGVIFTACITFVCTYAIDTLLRMQYIQCQRLRVPFLAVPTSMRIGFKNGPRCLSVFAPVAQFLVDFFLVTYQLGICTAYVVFIAKSIKKVAEPGLVEDLDLKLYMLMIFIPVCLTNYIRDLKKLMPLSLVANILVVLSLICCLYYIFFVGEWKTDTVKIAAPLSTWPLFVGTVLFALEAVGVIIAMEHNMQNPGHFLGWKGIFPWCLTIVSSLYMFFGLIGYLKYGVDVQETIFETLPKHEWLSLTTYATYGLCIFLSYPLQCFVSLEILWGNYIRHVVKDPLKECIFEYTLRTITVICTFLVAALIPHIDILISLVGAFCISTLGIIFPFTLELCTLWPDELGCGKWILVKDIFLIIFGFGALIIGTYVTLHNHISGLLE